MIRLFAIVAFAALLALVQASTQDDNNASNSAADKIKLLVYHNHDGTYKKRGEITGSPSSLVYTSTIQDDGIDVSSALYQVKVRNEATDQIILSSAKTVSAMAHGRHSYLDIRCTSANSSQATGPMNSVSISMTKTKFIILTTTHKAMHAPILRYVDVCVCVCMERVLHWYQVIVQLPVKTPREPATVVKVERHTIGAK